jgi:LPXTG-motif cell wall-anchored protein
MNKRLLSFTAISLFVIGVLLAPKLRADEWDKKTVFTFNEPVEVPGAVLAPGTYVFKLADVQGDRNVVQIFNADETQVIATILAIPDYHDKPSDKTIVTFDERPSDEPEALKSWFYPGDEFGQEFVYPKAKATQLAQVNSKPVPSIPDDVTETAAMTTAPVIPATGASLVKATAAPTAPSISETVSSTTTVLEVDQLPQTGSSLPLIALLGLACVAGGTALRRFATASK